MIPLTQKQLDLLNYLRACERCPSFDEMKEALGVRSKSGVYRLIQALEQRGFIRRMANRARAIELVEERGPLPSMSGFSNTDLASEAKRRGLVLGHIYRDAYGERKFERIAA